MYVGDLVLLELEMAGDYVHVTLDVSSSQVKASL